MELQSHIGDRPILRRATNRDCAGAAALIASVLTEYGLPTDPDGIDADVRDIEGGYDAKGGVFYVLEAYDGTIVGTCALSPMSDDSCELRKMYLAKAWRGMAMGKLMLDTILSDARRMKFRCVTLETASVLVEAIALYRSYGFKPWHNEHLCFRCDQAYRLDL